MKRLKRILPALLFALTGAACNKADINMQHDSLYGDRTPLSISVNMTQTESKSIISGTSLPDGASVGISLSSIDGGEYDGLPYSNIRFTADRNGSQQIWIPETDVMLSSSEASLRAYYPFDEEVKDLSSIPVLANDEVQTDYLYAVPVSGLYNHNPDASIRMKHALAAIRISLKRGSYTGTGTVSKVQIKGVGLATAASLDAGTGKLHSITGAGTAISPDTEPFILSDTYKENDIIVIPKETGKPMDIEVIIDGEPFCVTIPEARIAQGRISVYEATVNNSEIDLTSVKIDEWTYDKEGNPTLGSNWTVRLTGDREGISFASTIEEDGSIRIMAVPMLNDAEVMSPTVTGDADYTEEVDNNTGILTITLDNVRSDIDISYDGYNFWITATYEITDISSPVAIMNGEDSCQKILMEGREINISKTYRFSSTGTHTARIMLKRNTAESIANVYGVYNIPASMFSGNKVMTSVRIPEGMTHVNAMAFYNCKALSEIDLPETIKTIGYYALYGCSSLTEVIFPDNAWINYSALSKCTSLTKVKLPANATQISSGLLSGCTSLRNIEIPPGVTSIDYNAFQSSGLTELHLPDGLKIIPDRMCQYCKQLVSVRFPSGLTSIGSSAFASCPELNTLIHADGTEYQGCVNIPEGVTEIKSTAFYDSEKFSSVHLPSTLNTTEYGAFAIKNISHVSISEENDVFDVRGNAIIETATNTMRHGFKVSYVDRSVTSIGDYAFYQVDIPSIDFHEGINEIGSQAFTMCDIYKIISRAEVPPVLNTRSFGIGSQNGVLIVPSGSLEAYRSAWFKDEAGYLGYNAYKWSIRALQDGE